MSKQQQDLDTGKWHWTDEYVEGLEQQLAELEAKLAELDNMLVVSHLGTLDSFESVAHAVRALVELDLSAEKYFEGQQLAALREALNEAMGWNWLDDDMNDEVANRLYALLQERGE